MDGDEEWNEPKYKNWVRGAKGLEYLQEGLEPFVGNTALRHRNQTVQKVTNALPAGSPLQCNQCTRQNLLPEHAVLKKPCNKNPCIQRNGGSCFGSRQNGRRKCPNGICSKLYDEIVHAHRYKDPMWNNTDPSTWCSDPLGWSFVKCFQTTPNPGTSSSETDAAGLLSVILSDEFFNSEVSCNLVTKGNIFSAARDIRNKILHSPKMELEDSELQDYIDAFIVALQDPKNLLNDQISNQSVQNLVQLKNNDITISLSEHVKLMQLRQKALVALEQLQKKEREVVETLEEQKQETMAEIGAASTAFEKMTDSKIQTLREETEEAIQQINYSIQTSKKASHSGVSQSTIKKKKSKLERVSDFFGLGRAKRRKMNY